MIALADAQDRQEDARLTLALDETLEFGLVGDADIEVAVGCENNAIDGALVEARFSEAIRIRDAGSTCRRTACSELFESMQDFALVRNFGRLKRDTRPRCIGDDGNRVVGLQLIDEQPERVLDQRQAVRRFHRS